MSNDKRDMELLARLAELGGGRLGMDDVKREGHELVLPLSMDEEQAIDFLAAKMAAQRRRVTVSHTFNYRPHDGAVSTAAVLKETFGAVLHVPTMPDNDREQPEPPEYIEVATGIGTSVTVPWGSFAVPMLAGAVFETIEDTDDDEAGPLFRLEVSCLAAASAVVRGVVALIEQHLAAHSIYRGRAIDGATIPNFLDITGVDATRVVYAAETYADLEANVWQQLDRTDEYERHGVPLKRAVLLHGPYGTGKTLAITLTGQRAIAAGWTFIVARAGRDDMLQTMRTARLYEPSVVVFEDADQVADPNTAETVGGVSRVLDAFDGITAKSTRMLVVMTTNHVDRIHAGMMRPGRLDAVIEIGKLDPNAVRNLVSLTVPAAMLTDDIDWPVVLGSVDGYLPAFVTETAQRAIRYGLTNVQPGQLPRIDTETLVLAARSLRMQHDLQAVAPETAEPRHIDAALRGLVDTALAERFDAIEERDQTNDESIDSQLGNIAEDAAHAKNYASDADDHGRAIREYHGV